MRNTAIVRALLRITCIRRYVMALVMCFAPLNMFPSAPRQSKTQSPLISFRYFYPDPRPFRASPCKLMPLSHTTIQGIVELQQELLPKPR